MYYASLEEAYQNKGNFNLYNDEHCQQKISDTVLPPTASTDPDMVKISDCSDFVSHYHNCDVCRQHFRIDRKNHIEHRLSTIVIFFLLLIIFFKS
jgi:hypothetical protein